MFKCLHYFASESNSKTSPNLDSSVSRKLTQYASLMPPLSAIFSLNVSFPSICFRTKRGRKSREEDENLI